MSYFDTERQQAFGVDLSRYNVSADLCHYPNFDELAVHKPQLRFIGLRTGQSWADKDPAFAVLVREAMRIGLCVLPYHVIYPGEPALKQVDFMLKLLEGIPLEKLRLVLDLELKHNQSRTTITNTTLCCLELLQQETGRYPIIYSNAGFVNENLAVRDLPQVDWWLAQYYFARPYPNYTAEYPSPPALPKGVTKWLIHQTTNRGPAIGGIGRYMDYNRWNGDCKAVLAYFGRQESRAEAICPLDGLYCTCRPASVLEELAAQREQAFLEV